MGKAPRLGKSYRNNLVSQIVSPSERYEGEEAGLCEVRTLQKLQRKQDWELQRKEGGAWGRGGESLGAEWASLLRGPHSPSEGRQGRRGEAGTGVLTRASPTALSWPWASRQRCRRLSSASTSWC